MKNILLICILLLSTIIFASIEYQKFVGKWQEESRTYGKKKKKQTETNAANSLIYEFTEEGIFKRF